MHKIVRTKPQLYMLPVLAFLTFMVAPVMLHGQETEQQARQTILHKDSLFWKGYNACDTSNYNTFFYDDLEFYHDKGGITLGAKNMALTLQKNLCSNNDFRLRREEVKGSVRISLLYNSGAIYGAILSGEHVFYVNEKGKAERLDGHALFTHLWLLTDGVWKMKRILSYDHGPAAYINKRKEMKAAAKNLDEFVGEYKGTQTQKLIIKRENGQLTFGDGDKVMVLYAEKNNLFFTKERDLTFEFIKDGKNKVEKLVVRENGAIVEQLTAKR